MFLRTRILLAASLGIVGLTAATLTWVRIQADAFVNARVDEDLRRGQEPGKRSRLRAQGAQGSRLTVFRRGYGPPSREGDCYVALSPEPA